MIVVDASVAVKWFLPEEGAEQAQQLLLNAEKLIAPELIRFEVGGVFTRLHRLNTIESDDAAMLCQEWAKIIEQGALSLLPLEDDYHTATHLSLELKHPLADCFYLAVAQKLRSTIITADLKMAEKAEKHGIKAELMG